MATYALMVVLFQYIVTLYIKPYPIFRMLALGTLFYGIGAGSVTLGHTKVIISSRSQAEAHIL
jgi:hypothetical protein